MRDSRSGRRTATALISLIGIATFTSASGLTALAAPAAKLFQRAAEGACKITGKVTGLGSPLPGTAVTARRGDSVQGATSATLDGSYRLALPPDTYHLTIEMAGFARIERDVTLSGTPCDQVVDATLMLRPRATVPPAAGALARGAAPGAGRGTQAGGRGGRGAGFQTLEVNADAGGAQAIETGLAEVAGIDAPLLLPPGFRNDASSDAIAITGENARVDQGLLGDRRDALARGDFALVASELAQQFGVDAATLEGRFGGGRGGPGGPGGRGGAGGLQAGGRDGGAGGRAGGGRGNNAAGFLGRGGRGRAIQATADYTFGGSALDAAPFQLREGSARTERPYTRQNFGATIGGPVIFPGLYNGTNRTTFQLQYTGNVGSNLFDQYATVPTPDMRAGDFSTAGVQLINPVTGLPFAGNRIPTTQISQQATAILPYIPEPNLDGTTRNYHYTTATESVNNSVNVRVTHNFTPNAGRGGRGGARGGGGGGRGGARGGGAAGRGRAGGTNVTMNVQVQYRRNHGDQTNVFSTLGGFNEATTLGTPVSLNINRGRTQHSINVNFSKTTSATKNNFTNTVNVSGLAGIQGISSDPFSWGLPALSFTSISGLRDTTPSRRSDRRLSTEYTWRQSRGRHNLQFGGDFRWDRGSSDTEANANGSFVFTGLYTSAGASGLAGTRGADFADFLLGLPQQASVQYGPGNVTLTGRTMSLYAQDDWRWKSNLTLNLGLRYELLWPFVERSGQLVNLDVTPGFTAAAPVEAGATGAFSGGFPPGLLLTDTNNIAPRVGFATRKAGMVLRGGYGVSYNAGSYASIARQMASQPPFAVTNTQIGAVNTMLLMEDALSSGAANETTNTFGVEKDYVLGRVQTWNADMSRSFGRSWSFGANYTHTRGSNLDVVRAPNRDASGALRIEGVQPFTWQSAEGRSVLHSASFRLQRQQVRGLGGQISYTLARSRDNAPSIGGGGGAGVVAQNDQDINSEWAISNFDRRHRISTQLSYELPFGQNRRWLADGGFWAGLAENWRMSMTFNIDSGTPLTARVRGASRDVAAGVNGALRADYLGEPISIENQTIDQFFNTAAFAVPSTGAFGTSFRNVIIGPGSKQLDGQFSRDVRLGGNRTISIQLRATNLLNLVNYTGVDTYVNSPTFGQVQNVRGMRSAQLNLRFRF